MSCGELIPAALAREVELPREFLVFSTEGLVTHLEGGGTSRTRVPGLMLDRDRFDRQLGAIAVEAGAELVLGAELLARKGKSLLIRRGAEEWRVSGEILIGADGPRSRLRNERGGKLLLGVGARVRVPSSISDAHVYFAPWIPGGYGWLFPRGGQANVGIGALHPGPVPAARLLHRLVDLLHRMGLVSETKLDRIRTGLIPVGGPGQPPPAERVLLAGDAAGLTHPITGAGIGVALLSGRWAGEAAVEALNSGSVRPIRDFQARLEQRFGSEIERALGKRKSLEQGWDSRDFPLHIRQHWVAFPEYYGSSGGERSSNNG